MRIFVTTVGSEPHHREQRDIFLRLARADAVAAHPAVEDAAHADAILFVDLHQHPDDPFLRAFRRHPLVAEHRDRIFVYDERDLPFFTFPGLYASATARLARRWGGALAGAPYPHTPSMAAPIPVDPDLLFSFQGAVTHPVRTHILALTHRRCVLEDTTGVDFFSDQLAGDALDRRRKAGARYAEIIGRSKFVLCPRGHGPSSFRLYETLRMGRVPVVISDAWLPPPGVPWHDCIVRVAEKDVRHLPSVLERHEPQWPRMAAGARRVYDRYLAPTVLWHHYASSLEAIRGPRLPRSWWAQEPILRLAVRHIRAEFLPRAG